MNPEENKQILINCAIFNPPSQKGGIEPKQRESILNPSIQNLPKL